MTLTTILIIAGILLLLFLMVRGKGKNAAQSGASGSDTAQTAPTEPAGKTSGEIPGEVLSAIFMALHEELEEVHDVEHTVLTLDPVSKTYSPWSVKYHGLREIPRR